MKKIAYIFMIAILLAGGAVAAVPAPSFAQDYEYPPRPADLTESPWVGPDTPWVYYNGDWFLNGILYHYFGPDYGWAPYYAYAPTFIVRPETWYAPRWHVWYQRQPHFYVSFQRQYPYWRDHREGRHYDQRFYEQHNRGQGGGWQKGFTASSRSEGRKPGPARVAPEAVKRPAQPHVGTPERQQPAVQREKQPQQHQEQMKQRQPQEQDVQRGAQSQKMKRQEPAVQREQQPQQRAQEMKQRQPQQKEGEKEKQ